MKYVAVLLVTTLLILAGVWVHLLQAEPPASMTTSTLEQALNWYSRGDFDRARDLLKLYCDTHAHHVEAKVLYARVCAESGRTSEAAKALEGVKDNAALLIRARIAKNSGQIEVALAMIQGALRSDPNSAQAWRELGLLQFEQGQSLQAAASIQRSLQLDPKQEDLNRLYGEISMQAMTTDNPRADRTLGVPTAQDLVPRSGVPNIPDPRSKEPRHYNPIQKLR